MTGNAALAWGLLAASELAKLPLFLGSYPITPASDILHELSKHKNFGVRTLQAEDEIAGIGAALGAAFGGALGVTTTSGPGIDFKAETVGLAVSLELPLLIVDIQRGGPSTGLPTKTEQSDLLHAMFGRHGEAPVAIVAAKTPRTASTPPSRRRVSRFATAHRCTCSPTATLRTGPNPGGSPTSSRCRTSPCSSPPNRTRPTTTASRLSGPTSATRSPSPGRGRSRARRARASHRRSREADGIGTISYEPANHEDMVRTPGGQDRRDRERPPTGRGRRPDRRRETAPVRLGLDLRGHHRPGSSGSARLGKAVAQVHLVHLNPFPPNLGEVLRSYEAILVPEGNLGHLTRLVRSDFLVDARVLSRVQGSPFRVGEIEQAILQEIDRVDQTAAAPRGGHRCRDDPATGRAPRRRHDDRRCRPRDEP